MASANQELPAVVAAAVVVRDCLHIICGNGAHYTWDKENSGWAECAPVPESFVGRKAAQAAYREAEKAREKAYWAKLEAKREKERTKSDGVVVCEIVARKGDAGASITHIFQEHQSWAMENHTRKLGRPAVERLVEKLLASGLLEKRHDSRNRPVFLLVCDEKFREVPHL